MTTPLGAYRLLRELGPGGAAQVWEAAAPDGGHVALKIWQSLGADPDGTRSRIRREADLVAGIDHPGVVALLDAQVEGDRPFLAFEYIDGPSLEDLVRRQGPLSGPTAREVVTGVLRALVEVHAAPVAHLDVKPANVILDNGPDGLRPVLIDFGIARVADVTHTALTGYSMLFASPEQLEGKTAYTPSDVFSWASTVYFLVTGRPPFGTEPADAQTRIRDPRALPDREPFTRALQERAVPLWEILVDCWRREPALRWPLHVAPTPGAAIRPTADTRELLAAVEEALAAPLTTRLQRGRINPRKAGPTTWHELGAQMRSHRRHGQARMTARQLVHQRELLGKLGAARLLAYEMGWLRPPYDIVSVIDHITEANGYLRYLHACARGGDVLGLTERPTGRKYPLPGDRSEQHEDTPTVKELEPWEKSVFPLHIRNSGRVPWQDRFLRPVAPVTGTETVPLRGARFPVPPTGPGEVAVMEIPVRAPGWPGVYRQQFKMVDVDGEFCFPGQNTLGIEVMIQVVRRDRS
ncbi:protein kinase [Streptomyces actuosus]|uniref:Protein kinase n=1 Tax=Streptomyces actuosus TaxID=1885 RepID=A0ABS2VZY0_STRAS|nr:protein kinase [Streptomyces actuosus]MBN0048435.1 protein kinase [Streptomyces actuosus]